MDTRTDFLRTRRDSFLKTCRWLFLVPASCLLMSMNPIASSAQSTSATAPSRTNFDGDNKSDMVVYQNNGSFFSFWVRKSGCDWNCYFNRPWGSAGDIPMAANDFDGDGIPDMTVWRPNNDGAGTGAFYVRQSSCNWNCQFTRSFGAAGDVPIQGNFSVDSKADMALWRPNDGSGNSVFSVLFSHCNWTCSVSRQWGRPGDMVLADSDFDGDGAADMAVWTSNVGNGNAGFLVLKSSCGFNCSVTREWGHPGDVPLAGTDVDGDGKADMVVWRPNDGAGEGAFYVRKSGCDWDCYFIRPWGAAGDIPLPRMDVDGDGRADLVVWRPNDSSGLAMFYVRKSSCNWDCTFNRQWGRTGDVPVANKDFDGDRKVDLVVWRPNDNGAGSAAFYVRKSTCNWDCTFRRDWGASTDVVF